MLRIISLTLFLTLGTNIVSAETSCPGESILRSVNSTDKTTITFINNGSSDETSFKIYWINYEGKRVQYGHIFPGSTHKQDTFLGHPWVVTSPVPGGGEDCIDLYLPRFSGETITLGDGAGGSNNANNNAPQSNYYPRPAGSWGGKVRSGPGTSYSQVASLPEGESVTLLEESKNIMNGYPWYRIRFRGGRTGYKWGGILCAIGKPQRGLFQICP